MIFKDSSPLQNNISSSLESWNPFRGNFYATIYKKSSTILQYLQVSIYLVTHQ